MLATPAFWDLCRSCPASPHALPLTTGGLDDPHSGASHDGFRTHPSSPSSAAEAFKQAFLQAGRTALCPEDITANVRTILNGGAHALPQTKASLDKVAKSLREVRAARESGGPLPAQRHRCVEECLKSDDPVMVGLMLLALQVDLDTRLQRLATLSDAA